MIDIKQAIKFGRTLQLSLEHSALHGARVKIIKQSKRTGGLTIEFVKDHGLHHVGSTLHVAPYNVVEVIPTIGELKARAASIVDRSMVDLELMIKAGREAREKFAAAILNDQDSKGDSYVETLVTQVRWANGIKEDLKATHAQRILLYIESEAGQKSSMERALEMFQGDLTRDLIGNRFSGGSSSAFSNAVEATRAEVASEMHRWIERRLEVLREISSELKKLEAA
jgi:hypothetical protein